MGSCLKHRRTYFQPHHGLIAQQEPYLGCGMVVYEIGIAKIFTALRLYGCQSVPSMQARQPRASPPFFNDICFLPNSRHHLGIKEYKTSSIRTGSAKVLGTIPHFENNVKNWFEEVGRFGDKLDGVVSRRLE